MPVPVPSTVNKQFIDGINRAVSKVVAARQVLPASTVENKIIPVHEDYLQNIISWRLDQLSAARVFGNYGAPAIQPVNRQNQKLTGVPAAIQTAYNAQVATITTAYNAKVTALKNQLDSITKDAQAKEKQAQKLKDKATINQLKAAVASAKQAYKDGVKAADVQRQNDMTALANNFQNLLNQASQSNQTLPPVSGGGTPVTTGGSSGGQPQYPIYDSAGNFIGYSTVPPAPQTSSGGVTIYNQPPVDTSGGDYNYPDASVPVPAPYPSQTPSTVSAPQTSVLDDLFAIIGQLLGGLSGPQIASPTTTQITAPQPAGVAPVFTNTGSIVQYDQSTAGNVSQNQLDIFDQDPWGGSASYGEFVPMFGNRVIRRLNQMPIMPKSSFGYSQWGTIISGVIQAAGQIGGAAATAALSPGQKKTAAPPVVVQAPAPAQNNTTPWLIGGGVALAVVGLAMFMNNRR